MRMTSGRLETTSSDQLHPWIYRTIVGLAVVLILSVWGFFGPGYSGLALAVVTIFIFIAVAVPAILWRIWRSHATDPDQPESFAACPLRLLLVPVCPCRRPSIPAGRI